MITIHSVYQIRQESYNGKIACCVNEDYVYVRRRKATGG